MGRNLLWHVGVSLCFVAADGVHGEPPESPHGTAVTGTGKVPRLLVVAVNCGCLKTVPFCARWVHHEELLWQLTLGHPTCRDAVLVPRAAGLRGGQRGSTRDGCGSLPTRQLPNWMLSISKEIASVISHH